MVKPIIKHYPPAYYRYRKAHPVISVVLTKELKELLDVEREKTGVSYSRVIMKYIMQGADTQKSYDAGYAAGEAHGYADGHADGHDEAIKNARRISKLK
jgi:flagellar biosynthesis/type III secretory pathway protein FliH